MDGISCGILTLVSFLIVSPSTLTVTSDTIKALGGDTATISTSCRTRGWAATASSPPSSWA